MPLIQYDYLPQGNFTWTAAGAWASFLALIGIIVRQVGPWRKQSIDAEKTFRDDLISRVTKLEKTLARQRIRHEAERSIDRHRLNNVTQCFDAMMLMLKSAPERAAEIIVQIEEMRASQIQAEALEKGLLHKTMMAALRDEDGESEE